MELRIQCLCIDAADPARIASFWEAALGWRFEPTLLNNVAVRVTGVITFAFKLNVIREWHAPRIFRD